MVKFCAAPCPRMVRPARTDRAANAPRDMYRFIKPLRNFYLLIDQTIRVVASLLPDSKRISALPKLSKWTSPKKQMSRSLSPWPMPVKQLTSIFSASNRDCHDEREGTSWSKNRCCCHPNDVLELYCTQK